MATKQLPVRVAACPQNGRAAIYPALKVYKVYVRFEKSQTNNVMFSLDTDYPLEFSVSL